MKKVPKKKAKRISALATAVISAAFMLTSCASNDSSSKADVSVDSALSIQQQKVIDSPEWLTKLDAVKGCQVEYTKVNKDHYWSGDSRDGMHFNEFVNINDVPGLDPDECEHLIDYTYEYQYCLDMGYNTECIPAEGSCFFFHCMSLVKPYTGGCVAVNEATMKLIMQKLKPGCKITIDKAEALGIDLDEARTTANKLC